MGCHLQHIHRRVCIVSLVVCSVCCLSFCAVHGHMIDRNLRINDYLLPKVAHHVKRESDIHPIAQDVLVRRPRSDVQIDPGNATTHKSPTASVSSSVLQALFAKYGENGALTFEGFERLLKSIGLHSTEHNENQTTLSLGSEADHDGLASKNDVTIADDNKTSVETNPKHINQCPTSQQILHSSGIDTRRQLQESDFINICPTLIYFLDKHTCVAVDHLSHDHDHIDPVHQDHDQKTPGESDGSWHPPSAAVWGYSFIACLVISAIGLLAVAIIPIINKVIYNHLLHFLVALAIGSLSGDALLHLLPHAVIPHVHHHHDMHSNETDHEHESHIHDDFADKKAVWCGLTALGGIILFFIVERLVGFCSERKRRKHDKHESQPESADVSKSSTGLIGGVPKVEQKKRVAKLNQQHASTSCEEMVMMVHPNKDVRQMASDAHDEVHKNCDGVGATADASWGQTQVIGGHHHSHEVPKSVAAVAWVVIFGDGLHNFADGLAIGSAFANSLTGGLSTSIAVICHELPHELGDFAMLLKAGMSARKALVYNCVSSLLCVLGVLLGVALGNFASINPWIFSIIAGMFLYIALVDMLPEMKSVDPRKGEHPLIHLGLQLMGMLIGSSIMLLIALFEDKINLY